MTNNIVNPFSLKGNEQLSRMRQLMGESVEKNSNISTIELTKVGPDGKIYAIVREGHSYYIKLANKDKGILLEDFNYIGGLKNKTDYVFPSYSKAIKQLNLKFINISEAYGKSSNISTFTNDNILVESKQVFKNEDSMKETLDKVGEEDADIDNDGEDNDPNDVYIKNKRLKISDAITETVVLKKKV